MTFLKRLRVLTAVLGVAAIATATVTHLLGDNRKPAADAAGRPDANRVVEELTVTKFSTQPALTYQIKGGDLLFAWQIKPALEAAPARPRDVVVMVDTSASQAGLPLKQARNIVAALGTALAADDRVSVWTVSTPLATRPLTNGFFPANSDEVKAAAAALTEVEYGSGATDLKNGLSKAVASIPQNRGRHQMVLFLGDGESTFNPISEGERVAIGQNMDNSDVFFFAVPLGVKVNPHNLHGLAALTGGSVVRLVDDVANPTKQSEIGRRLVSAFDTPVVKVEKQKFGEEIGEVFPARLPPLRADRSTLVMGTLAKLSPTVTATVSGKVGLRDVKLELSQNLPQSSPEHFFLNMMLDQWRAAPHKEAPAILQSDRALALAATQVKLYRDEFLTQALWAATADRFDEATKLYGAARKIDPNDQEAAAGLAVMEQLKSGKVTKAELTKRFAAKDPRAAINALAQDPPPVPVVGQPPKPDGGAPVVGQPPVVNTGAPQAAGDILKEAAQRRRIEEERYRVITDATIRRGRQLLRTDPDGAYQDLKRQRDEILGYDAIGEGARTQLVANLEAVMREVFVKGAEVKRQAAVEREQIARTRQRLNEFDRLQNDEDRVKSRIDAFKQLMQQARFELAYQEAQLMVQERIAQGRDVPAAAVAGYTIGQHATQLREWRELVRIREDRFLLTMMQTEKSHIPYPDEPPVHFPPATVWRELTGLRRDKYLNQNLGNEPTRTQIELQDKLESRGEWQEKRVSFPEKLTGKRIGDVLNEVKRQYKGLAILPMYDRLKADGIDPFDEKVLSMGDTVLDGLVLGTFLDIVLQSVGCTYIVRPEYIEITTFMSRSLEKVTRAFPVADLVIPIPSSVNQQTLQQNLNIQNQTLAIFGVASGAAIQGQQFNGNFGFGGGNFGGGFGQPGGGGGGLGNMGGLFPMGGGGQAMGQNQGFGGGFGGFGGGQLGQFGNLGGQFGIQGGDQSMLLIEMIHQTVARGEWLRLQGQAPIPLPGDPAAGGELPTDLLPGQLNTVGYYPPARALIIRGTSRYHSGATVPLRKADGPMAAAPKANNGGVGLAQANPPAGGAAPAGNAVAAAPGKQGLVNPNVDAKALQAKLSKDPKRAWSEAIDWTVTDPGLIVATAEFLMQFNEYGHAAEVLKGNLRKGLATDAWAHEALSVALQMSQGSPAEIERAAVSAIDLDPTDAKAYLKAAKVEHDLKNHDLAVAFCKKAAEFGPDQPRAYANALVYAEASTDVKADSVEWAVGNLLKRDWSNADGIDYHAQAKGRLESLVAKYKAAGAKVDGLNKILTEQTSRDVVIELLWQGSADLDLTVTEPSGSVCGATRKRTTGGGVLAADLLNQKDDSRSETYTAATAFSGTYKVGVKRAFGQAIGNTATVKVTRFKGTPKESHDLFTVNLSDPKPVEVKVEGGNRSELAVVTEDVNELRAETTGAAVTSGPSGLSGGVGTAGSAMTAPVTGSNGPALPVVLPSAETRLAGIGAGAADMRMDMKVNADRKTMTVNVRPVFASNGKDVAMPKVSLMPGGEGR